MPEPQTENSLRKLYDSTAPLFSNFDDFDTFKKKIANPESRRKFYDAVTQHPQGYNLGEYDFFSKKVDIGLSLSRLGQPQLVTPTSPVISPGRIKSAEDLLAETDQPGAVSAGAEPGLPKSQRLLDMLNKYKTPEPADELVQKQQIDKLLGILPKPEKLVGKKLPPKKEETLTAIDRSTLGSLKRSASGIISLLGSIPAGFESLNSAYKRAFYNDYAKKTGLPEKDVQAAIEGEIERRRKKSLEPAYAAEEFAKKYIGAKPGWPQSLETLQSNPLEIASQAMIENIPQSALFAGATAVDPFLGGLLMYTAEAGETSKAFSDLEKAGVKIDPVYRDYATVAKGALNAALEKTSVDKILEKAGPGAKGMLLKLLGTGATEGGTEWIQEVNGVLAETGAKLSEEKALTLKKVYDTTVNELIKNNSRLQQAAIGGAFGGMGTSLGVEGIRSLVGETPAPPETPFPQQAATPQEVPGAQTGGPINIPPDVQAQIDQEQRKQESQQQAISLEMQRRNTVAQQVYGKPFDELSILQKNLISKKIAEASAKSEEAKINEAVNNLFAPKAEELSPPTPAKTTPPAPTATPALPTQQAPAGVVTSEKEKAPAEPQAPESEAVLPDTEQRDSIAQAVYNKSFAELPQPQKNVINKQIAAAEQARIKKATRDLFAPKIEEQAQAEIVQPQAAKEPAVGDVTAPKKPTPDRMLFVGRGYNGSIRVIFPNKDHADLYSYAGRFRRGLRGESGKGLTAGVAEADKLAKEFGVTREEIFNKSNEYRQQIRDGIKNLQYGEDYTAPSVSFEKMPVAPAAIPSQKSTETTAPAVAITPTEKPVEKKPPVAPVEQRTPAPAEPEAAKQETIAPAKAQESPQAEKQPLATKYTPEVIAAMETPADVDNALLGRTLELEDAGLPLEGDKVLESLDRRSQELYASNQRPQEQAIAPEITTPSRVSKVQDKPISSLNADPSRFQNRATDFSEKTAATIAEQYDPNLFDPIVIWKDPKDGKDYVLSGHSRLEGMKRRGEKTIPARYFNGTEAEAMRFARLEANRLGTAENLGETINAYKEAKRQNLSKARLKALFDGDVDFLEAIQNLDEKGDFINILGQPANAEFPYIKRFARAVGALRAQYPDKLTDRHEQQIFDFLYKGESKNTNIKLETLTQNVESQITHADFKSEQPLILRTGEQPTTGTRARKDTAKLEEQLAQLRDLRRKMNKAVGGSPELDAEIARLEKGISDIVRSQGDLFSQVESDKPITPRAIIPAERVTESNQAETIARFSPRFADEQFIAGVLSSLRQRGITPAQVSEQFWGETYEKLNGVQKDVFEKFALGEDVDENLYVALMAIANSSVTSKVNEAAARQPGQIETPRERREEKRVIITPAPQAQAETETQPVVETQPETAPVATSEKQDYDTNSYDYAVLNLRAKLAPENTKAEQAYENELIRNAYPFASEIFRIADKNNDLVYIFRGYNDTEKWEWLKKYAKAIKQKKSVRESPDMMYDLIVVLDRDKVDAVYPTIKSARTQEAEQAGRTVEPSAPVETSVRPVLPPPTSADFDKAATTAGNVIERVKNRPIAEQQAAVRTELEAQGVHPVIIEELTEPRRAPRPGEENFPEEIGIGDAYDLLREVETKQYRGTRKGRIDAAVDPPASLKQTANRLAAAGKAFGDAKVSLQKAKEDIITEIEERGGSVIVNTDTGAFTISLNAGKAKLSMEDLLTLKALRREAAEAGGYSLATVGRGFEIAVTPADIAVPEPLRGTFAEKAKEFIKRNQAAKQAEEAFKDAKADARGDLIDNYLAQRTAGVKSERIPALKGTAGDGTQAEIQVRRQRSAVEPDVEEYAKKIQAFKEEAAARGEKGKPFISTHATGKKTFAEALKGGRVIETREGAAKPQAPPVAPKEETPAPAQPTAENVIVTKQEYDAALARLRQKLLQFNMGVDPSVLGDLLQVGTYHVEKGAREFKAWSAKMLESLGEQIYKKVEPVLRQVFDEIKKRRPGLFKAAKAAPVEQGGLFGEPEPVATTKPPAVAPKAEETAPEKREAEKPAPAAKKEKPAETRPLTDEEKKEIHKKEIRERREKLQAEEQKKETTKPVEKPQPVNLAFTPQELRTQRNAVMATPEQKAWATTPFRKDVLRNAGGDIALAEKSAQERETLYDTYGDKYVVVEDNGGDTIKVINVSLGETSPEERPRNEFSQERRTERPPTPAEKQPIAESANIVPGTRKLVDTIKDSLKSDDAISNKTLTFMAEQAYGGTRAEGKFTPKDAYDALEMAVNEFIADSPGLMDVDAADALTRLRDLMALLPRQTDRTLEQAQLQQFSTPPTQAFVAAKILNPQAGETVLEPSAGVGGLAVFAKAAGANVHTNEISPRRAELLRMQGYPVTDVDAEIINDVLPDEIKPTAILMNPPFSATGGRVEKNKTEYGAKHVESALARLENGGRLVAIVGQGMALDRPSFTEWWKKIAKRYNVRANIGIPGDEYSKYGTTFGNQIIVIDKNGPTPGNNWAEQANNIVKGDVKNLEEALNVTAEIAADRKPVAAAARPEIGARPLGSRQEPVRAGVGEGLRAAPGRGGVVEPGRRTGEIRGTTGISRPQEGAGVVRAAEPRVELEQAAVRRGESAERPGIQVRGGGVENVRGGTERPAGAGEVALPEQPSGLEATETGAVRESEASGKFVKYKPAKLKGGVPHPANIVESSSMAAVDPPDITYKTSLPPEIIKEGKLSDLQLETVHYAGQQFEKIMPNGQRMGYFIGDGTGVGKGRQIAGIVADQWNKGVKRILWVSASRDLMEDAKRDVNDLGVDIPISSINDYAPGGDIEAPKGIVFSTYTSLIAKSKSGKQQTRQKQLENWLGNDSIIIFDEAHKAKNALAVGPGGEPTQTAQAVIGIQDNLPKAKVVYSSATGATDVRNMAYMTRLGLWGPKTSFSEGFIQFLSEIDGGGVGAMEMVARDMKALGMYSSRAISFEGVDYREVIHELDDNQRRIYNIAAQAWQTVLQNIEAAIGVTNGGALAKKKAMSAFWGAHQRFFKQIVTAMKVPTAIKEVERSLDEGKSVVLSIIGTGESRTKDLINKATAEGSQLEDLDFTPRETIAGMVDRAFPTQLYQDETDPNTGNTIKVPVVDKEGNPVQSKEALEMKQALLEKLSDLNLPDNPLDQIVNYFGADKVAEMTGRKRRLIRNAKTGKVEYAKRAPDDVAMNKINLHENKQFQDGKKHIAIISDAAATGISLHASNRAPNKQRRVQITLELGWSADKQMQTFGRTHRTDQASAPEYVLLSTDIGGEKRFSSTIAKRLASLGALTKGQRDATGGGDLAKYNFETKEGPAALARLYQRMMNDAKIGDRSKRSVTVSTQEYAIGGGELDNPRQALRDMGILKQKSDGTEDIDKDDWSNVTRFLNRVLALDIDRQNVVFDEFVKEFEDVIRGAKESGTFDDGVADMKGESIRLKGKPEVIHKDANTGAETLHYAVDVDVKTNPFGFEEAQAIVKDKKAKFYQQKRSGNFVLVSPSGARTDQKTGRVFNRVRLWTPTRRSSFMDESDFLDKYEAVPSSEVKDWWVDKVNQIPSVETEENHIIGGAILPLWQKLKTTEAQRLKVVRAQTDDKKRVVGILIPEENLGDVLRSIGVSRTLREAPDIFNAVLNQNDTVPLAGGLTLKKSRVHGDEAIELTGADSYKFKELRGMGMINEQIDWKQRFFVPTDEAKGIAVLNKLLKTYPAIEEAKKEPAPSVIRESETPYIVGDVKPEELAPIYYSQLERTLEKKLPNSGTAEQFAQMIDGFQRKGEFKKDEIEWLGLHDWLAEQKGKVSKQDILDFVRENQVEIREVTLGETASQRLKKAEDEFRKIAHNNGVVGQRAIQMVVDIESGFLDEREIAEPLKPAARELKLAFLHRFQADDETINPAKFSQYVLPGGENYRELLLTLPTKIGNKLPAGYTVEQDSGNRNGGFVVVTDKGIITRGKGKTEQDAIRNYLSLDADDNKQTFKSSHFDEPNILAHVRFNERTDADGKRVLFVEEVQSDWHQKGRQDGYKSIIKVDDEGIPIGWKIKHLPGQDIWELYDDTGERQDWTTSREGVVRSAQQSAQMRAERGVPNAPFKTTWHELVMKRMLRYAAENGFDKVAWTTGEQQAARYPEALQKQVDHIRWQKKGEETRMRASKNDRKVFDAQMDKDGRITLSNRSEAIGKNISDVVGKEMGQRIMSEPRGEIAGKDFVIGGEGMKGFYDKILPQFMDKYGKKWGAKVGETVISVGDKKAIILQSDWQAAVLDQENFDTQEISNYLDDENNLEFESEDDFAQFWRGDGYDSKFSDELETEVYNQFSKGEKTFVHSIDITTAMRQSVLMQGQALFEPQLLYEPNYDKRPDANAKTDQLAKEAVESIAKNRRRGRVLLANAISAEAREKGTVNLIGKEVRTSDDVAALAQVYRDPRWETLRYIFVKDGKVVFVTGVSSRLPASAPSFPNMTDTEGIAWLRDLMFATEADGYYLLHNHPSGQVKASRGDLYATAGISNAVDGFKGHVIIDSNRYTIISQAGTENGPPRKAIVHNMDSMVLRESEVEKFFGEEKLLKPSIFSPIIGTMLNTPEAVAKIGQKYKAPDGWVTLISHGNSGVRGIMEVESVVMQNPKRAAATIRRFARQTGAGNVFLVSDQAFWDKHKLDLAQAINNGFLRDAVSTRGYSIHEEGLARESSKEFGIAERRGREVREGGLPKAKKGENPQIYTENFKKWFGDWENKPTNASKVVDAEGKPLVVYHGTPNKFSEFNKHYSRRTDDGYFGDGFYFSPDPQEAKEYGNNIVNAYLKIEKPFRVPDAGTFHPSIFDLRDELSKLPGMPKGLKTNREIPDGYYLAERKKEPTDWNYDKPGIKYYIAPNEAFYGTEKEIYGEEKDDQLSAIISFNDERAGYKDDYDAWWPEQLLKDIGRDKFKKAAMNAGFDGVVVYDPDSGRYIEFVAYDPTQIKSSDKNLGTFSPTEPSIVREGETPYSKKGGQRKVIENLSKRSFLEYGNSPEDMIFSDVLDYYKRGRLGAVDEITSEKIQKEFRVRPTRAERILKRLQEYVYSQRGKDVNESDKETQTKSSISLKEDIPVFHGTHSEESFDMPSVKASGKGFGSESREGIWVTQDHEIASWFAQNAAGGPVSTGSRIYPLLIKKEAKIKEVKRWSASYGGVVKQADIARKQGYDGVHFDALDSLSGSYLIFNENILVPKYLNDARQQKIAKAKAEGKYFADAITQTSEPESRHDTNVGNSASAGLMTEQQAEQKYKMKECE